MYAIKLAFTETNLRSLIREGDWRRYAIKSSGQEQGVIDSIVNNIALQCYAFTALNHKIIGRNTIYSAGNLSDALVLRMISNGIKTSYRVKPSDRHVVISGLSSVLTESPGYVLIRGDITRFYESVDRVHLLNKINVDGLLTATMCGLLEKLFSMNQMLSVPGLPFGLSLSSFLSELYMRSVDLQMRKETGVHYYCRYVDDFAVVGYGEAAHLRDRCREILAARGLVLNDHKTSVIDTSAGIKNSYLGSFEYLGYTLSLKVVDKKKGVSVEHGMAEGKKRKIKSRIVRSFLDYTKNGNILLLIKRLRFLCDSYVIKNTVNGRLRGGVSYNYPLISPDHSVYKELDGFIRTILYSSKGKMGRLLRVNMNAVERHEVAKISMRTGRLTPRTWRYGEKEVAEIKACWRNENN